MKKQFHLSGIGLILGSIALTGCATQQTWSPELEQAREAYQQAASDPMVSSLAAAELDKAQKQLKRAEDAADYFKGNEVIAHEATLAQLTAQQAQQTARALTAKQNLRLAQGSTPAPASPTMATSPSMAAATPGYSQPAIQPGSAQGDSGQGHGRMYGGSTQQNSEVQLIAQQLAMLSEQIAQLQARVSGGAVSFGTQAGSATQVPAYQMPQTESAPAYPTTAQAPQTDIRLQNQTYATPELGAALPAPAAQDPMTIEPQAPAAPTIMVQSDARLREELRAMNARPSSRGMSLTLGERYFESGSARLWDGRAGRHLDNIAAVMSENTDLKLDIEAHTDNAGSAEQRDNLTADRAIAIKSALVLRGVNAARINTAGYGDTAPIADNSTELGRLQNRRVEIIFPNIEAL